VRRRVGPPLVRSEENGDAVRPALFMPLALAAIFLIAGAVSPGTAGAAAGAPESCPNAAVREQQNATYLPDCRAYELVDPASDEFGDVSRVMQVSEDGDHVAYVTSTPGEGVSSIFVYSLLVGDRTGAGWNQRDANLGAVRPLSSLGLWTPTLLSEDFDQLLLSTYVPGDPADENSSIDLYRVTVGSGKGTKLTPEYGEPPVVVGASADLSRVVWAELGSGGALWTTTDGADLERVSVLPDGSPADLGGVLAGQNSARGYPASPAVANANLAPHGGSHAMSVDGRRVFFYAMDPGGGGGRSLYVRDLVAGETIPVVDSQRSGEEGPRAASDAQFVSATPDGEVVYFFSAEQLTDAATVGGGIYRYDVVSKELGLITPATGGPPFGMSAAILADNDSRVYFTSPNPLLPGAVEGASNVYVTGGGSTRLIATEASLTRVSPNGRFALLASTAPLGGASNNGHDAVFEYDDASGELLCVSCRPDGSPSQGDAFVDRQSTVPFVPALVGPRAVTDDGRVFFTSGDEGVARDTTPSFDAYMYDAGQLSLLSSGTGPDAFVAESSDDGDDVFIDTRAPLVAADRDANELDVYDVPVGGGFLESPAPPAACVGDDCRRSGPAGPPPAAPATATFAGPGNGGVARHRKKHRRRVRHRKHADGASGRRHRGGHR
jgi:hypothetical protein